MLLEACQEEIGAYSLGMFLDQADISTQCLERPVIAPPDSIPATKVALLQEAMRNYYGTGSRGLLTRVGRAFGKRMILNLGWHQKIKLRLFRLIARDKCLRELLDIFQNTIDPKRTSLRTIQYKQRLLWLDQNSYTYPGQVSDYPICYITTGMLQAVLSWVTGLEYGVEEVSCKACGAEICQFQISNEFI